MIIQSVNAKDYMFMCYLGVLNTSNADLLALQCARNEQEVMLREACYRKNLIQTVLNEGAKAEKTELLNNTQYKIQSKEGNMYPIFCSADFI